MVIKLRRKQNFQVALRQLITEECANHFRDSDDKKNYCCREWTEDNICVYFSDNPEQKKCDYLETSVLPLNDRLMAQYYEEMELKLQKGTYRRRCKNNKCNRMFVTNSKNEQYCSFCKEEISKQKTRERNKRYYLNKIKDT